MDSHYIDTRFREELDGLEVNPPVEAWLAISEGIESKPWRRRIPLLLSYAAAIAALVVAAFSFWFFVTDEGEGDLLIASEALPQPMEPIAALAFDGVTDLPLMISEESIAFATPERIPDFTSDQLSPMLLARTQDIRLLQPETSSRLEIRRPARFPAEETTAGQLAYFAVEEDYPQLAVLPEQKPAKASGFSLGAHFAPQYNYRHLADNGSSMYAEIPFSSLESQILTFSAGLSVYYRLSPNWIIQTGMNYNNMGQFVRDIHAYQHVNNLPLYHQSQQIITSMGNITINDPYHHFDDARSSRVSSKQTLDNLDMKSLHKSGDGLTQVFRFAEVPLLVRYQLISKNAGLQLKGGFAASYLLQKDVYMGTDLMQSPIGETHGIEMFNLSLVGGFALNIPVIGGMSLHMEPTMQYFIQPFVHENHRARVLPYSFSLQTGVSYRF